MLSAEFDNEEGKDTAKEKKIKLTCIMKILMNEIVSDIENPQMVKDFKIALLFETFSKIIASPLDIIGRRKASRLEEIMHDSTQTQVQTQIQIQIQTQTQIRIQNRPPPCCCCWAFFSSRPVTN